MPLLPSQPAVLRYVDERRCSDGGYCFYRLPEPNAADTRYALAVRSRLGPVPADPATVAFLQALQGPDGAFPNVFVADHVLAGLALLGEGPRRTPGPYLLSHLSALGDHERPPEQLSALEGVRAAIEACDLAGVPIEGETLGDVLRHVRSFRHSGGGYGAGRPTLAETADAVAVLTLLGRPGEAAGTSALVAAAEDPRDGFIFLEPVAALVRASLLLLLRQPLRHPDRLRAFVLGLRHPTGGFVRSRFGGSPTLEYTYLAVETLAVLDVLATLEGPGSATSRTGARNTAGDRAKS